MIKFESTKFGMLEVDETKVIHFPEGLVGLPELKRFFLIDHRDTPLKWLQSLDDPDMSFIVALPHLIVEDFAFNVDPAVRQYLKLENDDDLVTFVTLRVHEEDVIANFQGPILINSLEMKGVQVVMDSPKVPTPASLKS